MAPFSPLLVTIALLCISQKTATAANSDGQCVQSAVSFTNDPFTSLAEAERSARCLAVCSQELDGIGDALVSSFGIWTSLDSSILQSQSCPRFYETKECQLGCLLRSNTLSDATCMDTCLAQCKGSCSATMNCGGPCLEQRRCRETWCRAGCEAAAQINDSTGSVSVPATPGVFTQQPILEEAGLFNVTAVDTSTLAPEEGTSVFVWRVEAANETLYILQSSLTEALDLSFFTCQTITISLAVVNRNGSSEFTSPAPVCVHGVADPPSSPRNFEQISTVDDPRPGFLGHAVITLEWDPPQQRAESLTGYLMDVFPRPIEWFPNDPCGVRTMYSIPKTATSYVLRAEEVGQIPQFGPLRNKQCSYVVTV
jgi:hypothetical protein